MPKRSSSRKTRRTKRKHSKKTKVRRSLGNLGKMSDTHHYKETVDAGIIYGESVSEILPFSKAGGVWIFRLTDFPIFQKFVKCYEFARLNKCTLTYWPKYNMQVNLPVAGGGEGTPLQSVSGTFVTAIDQIPLIAQYNGASGIQPAPTWMSDVDSDSGITTVGAARCNVLTASYVRGLQNSKETEFYKKVTQTFQPAFYSMLLDTPIVNTASQTIGSNASSTGCFQRNLKKWVNINTLAQLASTTGSDAMIPNAGPFYYGPVYAIDADNTNIAGVQLYDVRLTYSMSFKRVKGQI